jgi:hypothetical protein
LRKTGKVDLNSVSNSECRTIGGEAVAYHAFCKLGIPVILSKLGFSEKQIQQTALLVMGRLLYPGSERGTALWARKISGLVPHLRPSPEVQEGDRSILEQKKRGDYIR